MQIELNEKVERRLRTIGEEMGGFPPIEVARVAFSVFDHLWTQRSDDNDVELVSWRDGAGNVETNRVPLTPPEQ